MNRSTNVQHPLEARRQSAKRAGFYVPAKVRLGHIPKWLSRRMKAAGYDVDSGKLRYPMFDHWGSSVDAQGRPVFVSEPYPYTWQLNPEGIEDLAVFAHKCGLRVVMRPMSHHNTGECLRIEMSEPEVAR